MNAVLAGVVVLGLLTGCGAAILEAIADSRSSEPDEEDWTGWTLSPKPWPARPPEEKDTP